MGYQIKVQKVERPTNRSYYVNLPVVLAETERRVDAFIAFTLLVTSKRKSQ